MFWTKKPAFCGLILHTADTELGQYSILDTTITQSGSISAFFQPLQGLARRPPKSQVRTAADFVTTSLLAKSQRFTHYSLRLDKWGDGCRYSAWGVLG